MTLHRLFFQLFGLMAIKLLVLAGAAQAAPAAQPRVLVSIKPLELVLSAIAGEEIALDVLLEANASPHTYHMRPSDVARLTQADALVWVGPSMESFLTQVILSAKPKQTLALLKHPLLVRELEMLSKFRSHGLKAQDSHHHGHDHAGPDAHIWLSPALAVATAQVATELFSKLAPNHQALFRQRLEDFQNSVASTEKEIHALLAPVKTRGFIVTHDGYSYFVEHFGLNQVAALAISPDRQPGARHVAQLRQTLEQAKAQCLLLEPQLRPSYIASLVDGLGVKQQVVDPLGGDIQAGTAAYGTFLKTLASNVRRCLD